MSPEWRPMQAADLDAVERLGNAIHLDHPERPEVFAERRHLCPEGCFVLGEHAGYVISHPWAGDPPALDTLIRTLPAVAESWYIHDLALHKRARGGGAAGAIVARLAAIAAERGLARMSLVAVGNSAPFWARQGFAPAKLPAGKLASYGAGVAFMVRCLSR